MQFVQAILKGLHGLSFAYMFQSQKNFWNCFNEFGNMGLGQKGIIGIY